MTRRAGLRPFESFEPQRKLRIAAIGLRGVPSNYSGLETSAQCLYRDLARRGHEVTVYSRRRYVERPEDYYHGIHRVLIPPVYLRGVEALSHIGFSLAHALMRGDYDVLHMHALAPGLFAWIRRFSNIPIVSTVQGLDWQRAKWQGAGSKALRAAERSLARHADEMIVVSRQLQQYFERQYGRRTVHIPNGVDRLYPSADQDLLASFGLEAGRYVTFIGRLVPEKRIEDLIAAFRSMPESYRLAIVGEGGYTDNYVDHLREVAADDPRVVFTGLLKEEALSTVFSQAAAYVAPSGLEGLPMSLLECMELGVPAVVSDIQPHRELLGSVNGYDLFFQPGDVDQLTANLGRVLRAPEHGRRLARRAQGHVRQNHSWSVLAEATERVFYRALHRKDWAREASRTIMVPVRQPAGERCAEAAGSSRSESAWPSYERRRRVERPRRDERRRHLQPAARRLYGPHSRRRAGDRKGPGKASLPN